METENELQVNQNIVKYEGILEPIIEISVDVKDDPDPDCGSKTSQEISQNNIETLELVEHKAEIKIECNNEELGYFKPELESFKCDLCSYRTKQKFSLEIHISENHFVNNKDLIKLHKCDYCNYNTIRRSDLSKHILRIHNVPRLLTAYKCSYCNYETGKEMCLQNHIFKVHLNHNKDLKQLYQCNYCDFYSSYQNCIRLHVLNQHENQKFKCDHCCYIAKSEQDLNKHTSNRHKLNIYGVSVDKGSRRKESNRKSATRYRLKKKAELEEILYKEQLLIDRNNELSEKIRLLQSKIDYWKNVLERFDIKRK